MKHALKISAIALLVMSSISAPVNAASMNGMIESSKAKMSCSASCNNDYAQCSLAATDLRLTSSAGDIIPRTKANLMAGRECNATAMQCLSSC